MSTKNKNTNGIATGVQTPKTPKSKKGSKKNPVSATPSVATPSQFSVVADSQKPIVPLQAQGDVNPIASPVVVNPPVIIPPVNPIAPIAPQQANVNPAASPAASPAIIPGLSGHHDFLVTTGNAWNSKYAECHPVINNRDKETFPFARFEYEQHKFPGSKWSILKCSDTGHEIGVPFAEKSFYVFNNERRMALIEALQSGIEKLGYKLTIETAGTLRDRAYQFISFKIHGIDEIEAGGRKINSFLSLLNGLDKTMSFTFANSTITVCCANTFAMVNDDTGVPLYGKVKFTKNADIKIAEIPLIVESFISGNAKLLKRLNEWHNIGMTVTQAEQLFSAWLGEAEKPMSTRMANIVQRLKELHVSGKGNKGETALDCFNAVTEYYTHESAGKTDDATKQFESSEIGDGAKSKTEFFDFLVKSLVNSDVFTGVCKVGENILVTTAKAAKEKAAAK